MVIVQLASLVILSARIAAAQAIVEYEHIIAGATANVSGINKKIDSGLAKKIETGLAKEIDAGPAKKIDTGLARKSASQPSLDTKPAPAASVPEIHAGPEGANRLALEQQAGKDAAKITLKSAPSNAIVRVDGKPVGLTPLLLTLAPGNYKIEMEGPLMESGRQQVKLLPQEIREVEMSLSQPPRYPTHIQLR